MDIKHIYAHNQQLITNAAIMKTVCMPVHIFMLHNALPLKEVILLISTSLFYQSVVQL